MRRLDSFTESTDMNLSKLWETVKDRVDWRAAVHGITKSWTRHRDRKATTLDEGQNVLGTRARMVNWRLSLSSGGGRPGWYLTMSQFPPTQALN